MEQLHDVVVTQPLPPGDHLLLHHPPIQNLSNSEIEYLLNYYSNKKFYTNRRDYSESSKYSISSSLNEELSELVDGSSKVSIDSSGISADETNEINSLEIK